MKLEKAECALLRVCKGIVDQEKVIYAPYSLICQRAESCLEHRSERREEVLVGDIFLELSAVEILSH